MHFNFFPDVVRASEITQQSRAIGRDSAWGRAADITADDHVFHLQTARRLFSRYILVSSLVHERVRPLASAHYPLAVNDGSGFHPFY